VAAASASCSSTPSAGTEPCFKSGRRRRAPSLYALFAATGHLIVSGTERNCCGWQMKILIFQKQLRCFIWCGICTIFSSTEYTLRWENTTALSH
jgi:hypothetical protein